MIVRPIFRFVRPLRRERLLALMAVCVFVASASAQSPRPWTLETLELISGKKLEGYIADIRPTEIDFVEVVRPRNRPMYVVIRPLSRKDVAAISRLPPADRELLAQRLDRFRRRARIEQRRMEDVRLSRRKLGEHDWWEYSGERFTLMSNADETLTRRCVVRIDQIFRAYMQLMPPPGDASKRPDIMLLGSTADYREYLKRHDLEIENAAVYLPQQGRVVAGCDLDAFARRLQHVARRHENLRKRYEALADQLNDRLSELAAQMQARRVDAATVRKRLAAVRATFFREQRAALAEIDEADRRNATAFDELTREMMRRLYHEAFHAYLDAYLGGGGNGSGAAPAWLNEGLAQVFETAQLDDGVLRVDAPDPRRLARFVSLSEAELEEIMPKAVEAKASDFLVHAGATDISETTVSKLYCVSWAMAYYLAFEAAGPGLNIGRLSDLAKNDSDAVESFERLAGAKTGVFAQRLRMAMGTLN